MSNELRPSALDSFIGQEHVKDILKTSIIATSKLGERFMHTLFHGPPGTGKTTLSLIIANEMGVQCKIENATSIQEVDDMIDVLKQLTDGDILFLDEIHRLPKKVEEILYHPMEDGMITYRTKHTIRPLLPGLPTKVKTEMHTINLPRFTLIGATTNPGMLTEPLRDRFELLLELKNYNIEQMVKIAYQKADMLDVKIEEDAAVNLAKRCRGVARYCVRYIKYLRTHIVAHGDGATITNKDVDEAMKKLQVDEMGLTPIDYRVLSVLAESDKPVGLNRLAKRAKGDVDTVTNIVEPYLMEIGFIDVSTRGRIITDAGREYLETKGVYA